MKNVKICPSVLAADFGSLSAELDRVANADCMHIDIMDGHFVPNLSFGPIIAEAVAKNTSVPLDIHLMVSSPEQYILTLAKLNPFWITVHYEASPHLHRVLALINEAGIRAGVALNPHTPVSVVEEVLPDIHLLLVMTVNPGFGGQTYIPQMTQKIEKARELVAGYDIEIQVDGGVSLNNVVDVTKAGASVIVAGSAIFGAANAAGYIAEMRTVAG